MAQGRRRTKRELQEIADRFANDVLEISASREDWHELYILASQSLKKCAKKEKEEHPKRSGRIKLLADTLDVLAMSVLPLAKIAPKG